MATKHDLSIHVNLLLNFLRIFVAARIFDRVVAQPPIQISFSNYNFVFVLIRINVRIFAVLLSESLSYDNCPDVPLFAVYLLSA